MSCGFWSGCQCQCLQEPEVIVVAEDLGLSASVHPDKDPHNDAEGAAHRYAKARSESKMLRNQLSWKVTSSGKDGVNASDSIITLLEGGRVLEAQRELSRIEASGEDPLRTLSAAALERVRRISGRFTDSLAELRVSGDYVSEKDDQKGFDFSFRVGDGNFHIVYSANYLGFSPLEAFVALCEWDLCKGFNPDITSSTALEDEMPIDGVWRLTKQNKFTGSKEDNIRHHSVCDALDEPLGSLWISLYAPPESGPAPELGVEIPPPEGGASRNWTSRTTFCIRPLPDKGFRMTTSIWTRPSSKAYTTLSYTPSWGVKKLVRNEVGGFPDQFKKHLSTCKELKERLLTSNRATLYEHVRRRLAGEKPPAPAVPTTILEESNKVAPAAEELGASPAAN